MSSAHACLRKGKKVPLSPGERAAPFRRTTATADELFLLSRTKEDNYYAENISKVVSESKAPTDSEIMGSMITRLSQVEKQLNEAQIRVKEKEKRILILEEKCALYEKAQGGGTDQVQELQKKCRKLQKTIHEMETFLEDYGMIWVGEASSSDEDAGETFPSTGAEVTSLEPGIWDPRSSLGADAHGFQMDFDLVLRNIRELNLIAGDGEHVIRHTKDGARFEVKECVPITLYENGIFMFGGPFRPYSDVETQRCMQDIMDGYFPTELQSSYPDGVPFKVSDMRGTMFRDRRHERLFPGEGQVLSPEKAPQKALHINGGVHSALPERPRDSSSDITDEHHGNPQLSVGQFLSKLPPSVVRKGKILDVRCGVETLLKGEVVPSDVVLVETKAVEEMKVRMATDVRKRPPTPCNIATLRIKSESGDQTYVLKMKFSDTIREVRKYIDERRPKGSRAYDIKTSFPNKVYDDLDSTLQECRLTPNSTLHIVARKK